MSFPSCPALTKHKPIRKHQKQLTSLHMPSKNHIYTKNFQAFLREVAQPQEHRPTNPLISFLNIGKKRPVQRSLGYIPSIENMISQQQIEEEQIQSTSSIEYGFSEEIGSETSYELRVLYICLLQKIMKRIHHYPSASQRRKIIRGTWNIAVKYVKDSGYQIFNHIGTDIEWGLLELLNFSFRPTYREKYTAESRLQRPVKSTGSIKLI